MEEPRNWFPETGSTPGEEPWRPLKCQQRTETMTHLGDQAAAGFERTDANGVNGTQQHGTLQRRCW